MKESSREGEVRDARIRVVLGERDNIQHTRGDFQYNTWHV